MKKWDWSHLLLDEAHAVKNAMAMRTKRLTRCAGQPMNHFVVSMTPLPKLKYKERRAHDDNTCLLPFCLQNVLRLDMLGSPTVCSPLGLQ